MTPLEQEGDIPSLEVRAGCEPHRFREDRQATDRLKQQPGYERLNVSVCWCGRSFSHPIHDPAKSLIGQGLIRRK